jgi:GAF domain-containing protein
MNRILESGLIGVENRISVENLGSIPLGFFKSDKSGTIDYLSEEAIIILGCYGSKLPRPINLTELDAIVKCDLDNQRGQIMSGHTYQLCDHRFNNGQEKDKIINLFCSLIRNDGSEPEGILGVMQDITRAYFEKEELKETGHILSIISQVSEAVSSTADLDAILRIILTGVTAYQGLGFNRAFLFLLNETENCLEGRFAIGPGSRTEAHEVWSRLAGQDKTLLELLNDYRELETNPGKGLSSAINGWTISLDDDSVFSQALNNARSINVRTEDDLSQKSREILNHLDADHMAIAPIISKGKKLGIIAADNQINKKEITDSLVSLLQTFANHSAVAIEKSRLYDKILDRARELEEANIQLKNSQDQIIRAEKMAVIGELTSSIAHELKNPLTVIGGFADMILSTREADSYAEYLNIIISEAQRAETAIHQVLDFSRASRNRSRVIDFNQHTRKMYDMLLAKIKTGKTSPILELCPDTPEVWGNPDQLLHAMYQFARLIVDEIADEYKITIISIMTDSTVSMKIKFDGHESVRSQIVEVLQRVFQGSSRTQKLALLVAGETIRCHGGNYGVEGCKDNLPCMYLELPLFNGGPNA